MSWSKDEVAAFLAEKAWIGRLATVSAAGEPHVAPIWFEVAGDELHIHTMASSAKAQNIAATGRFSLAVDKEQPPYKGVILHGPARVASNDVVDSIALAKRCAVAYLGPEVGIGFGDMIAGIPGEHVALVLSPAGWEAWDYAQG